MKPIWSRTTTGNKKAHITINNKAVCGVTERYSSIVLIPIPKDDMTIDGRPYGNSVCSWCEDWKARQENSNVIRNRLFI